MSAEKKPLRYRNKELRSPYFVEYALSGRSKCSKCRQTIPCNALRIGAMSVRPGKGAVAIYTHVACFKCPSSLKEREQLTTIDSLTDMAEAEIAEMFARPTKPRPTKRAKTP